MLRIRLPIIIAAVTAVLTVASATLATAADDKAATEAAARLRGATEPFYDLSTAQAAGYQILADAKGITCIDMPDMGAMGVHYVRGDLVGDGDIDPLRPEAVIYEPQPDGFMQFVGVEYVVLKSDWEAKHSGVPALFGQQFNLIQEGNRYGLPPFYELHAWVWQHNSMGTFKDWNPQVSCAAGASPQAAAATGQ
jgi:hypothetical protein